MRLVVIVISFVLALPVMGQDWEIASSKKISKVNPVDYSDNIEMSGRKVSGIIHYDIDEMGRLRVDRQIIFPQLTVQLDENADKWQAYRAYLTDTFSNQNVPMLMMDGHPIQEGIVDKITIDGTLRIFHKLNSEGISINKQYFPSMDQHLFVEEWTIKNINDDDITFEIRNDYNEQNIEGKNGKLTLVCQSNIKNKLTVSAHSTTKFIIEYAAASEQEQLPRAENEIQKRFDFLRNIQANLILETPDPIFNMLFYFSKIRATESIFDSKMGLVHSPGGGRYYAGVWANDQAEYSGPFFPYLGIDYANEAALNAYKKFYEQMKTIPDHDQNLWSSYEMGGDLTCCGADRGDAAMIAYGGLQYLMAKGDRSLGEAYFPMIEWCLEYCHKQLNDDGVVASDTDEMEGRIPTGEANLSTNCLYYGALDLAVDYYQALDKPIEDLRPLLQRRKDLKKAIQIHFGTRLHGLWTYKYYKDHDKLRHWIGLPLVVGLHDRASYTISAIFNHLWTENGVHVEKNADDPKIAKMFWDRGTLYALKGTLIAGDIEKSMQRLHQFSEKRLLGERVPYVVEAYPEGDMAHLSAESALYCRVFTEGVFGIKPKSFKEFTMTPKMPKDWDKMALRNVHAFGQNFNIKLERVNHQIEITIEDNITKQFQKRLIFSGQTATFSFYKKN